MSLNPQYIPTSFLEEFRTLKLEWMIHDLRKCTPDELIQIKKEIDQLLHLDTE
ncbi:hypothetical protein [Hazenella coriacea]|uniref:Uncharacterized protein n=1 Tax=Hazenella coriacea TaxID=1179467 RepID=A0A4R3L7J6_9BACL|nr:hypothetical protein [Hazenella coriacea]TCS95005.1 hypothetical protein EDD58_103430 [Hazenella coriacea]